MARQDDAGAWADFGNINLDLANLDDMREVLRKLEQDNRLLLEDIKDLRDRIADEKADQSDVYYYLHKKLDDNYDVISALERQLVVESADRDKAEQEHGRQISELEHRIDEELTSLKENVIAMEEQVNSMHEAAGNKRDSEAKKEMLEKEIELTESVVESDLNVVRRKKLQEKQRVKRQVEEQIQQLSIELFSKKELELADKAKRVAENNKKLHTALQAKAKQAERIVTVNRGLAFENSSIRNDVDLTKASEAVLSKRVRVFHNIVIDLKTKLEQMKSIDTDMNEEKLADLEEYLAERSFKSGTTYDARSDNWAGLDNNSLTSDTSPGFQAGWTINSGAYRGLEYESVDELQDAVGSLKRLHEELQQEARRITARAKEKHIAGALLGREYDPVVANLIEGAEKWILLSKRAKENRGDFKGGKNASNLACWEVWRGPNFVGEGRGKGSGCHSSNASWRGKTADGKETNRGFSRATKTKIWRGTMQERQYLAASPTESGPLAKATTTPLLRRELFYHLVEEFRDFQSKSRPENEGSSGSNGAYKNVDRESKDFADDPRIETPVASREGAHSVGESLVHDAQVEQSSVASCANARSDGASPSDLSSISVRTLCDFSAWGKRNASTQTVAKHFPEKFATVRPARRLVVTNTFLTSNSTFSTSTVRSAGSGSLSTDGNMKAVFS